MPAVAAAILEALEDSDPSAHIGMKIGGRQTIDGRFDMLAVAEKLLRTLSEMRAAHE